MDPHLPPPPTEIAGTDAKEPAPSEESTACAAEQTVTLTVPMVEFPAGANVSRHLDVRLTHEQATTLKQITEALDRQNVRLADGRRCIGNPDTIRWLLEQVALNPPAQGG